MQSTSTVNMPASYWEYQASKTVYRLDPTVPSAAVEHRNMPRRRQQVPVGTKAAGNGTGQALRLSRNPPMAGANSQGSGHHRRAEAPRAVQTFIIQEQPTPPEKIEADSARQPHS